MRRVAFVTVSVLVLWGASLAQAQTCRLFGAEGADEDRGFWELNALNGEGVELGDPGQAVTALAFQPSTGILYGATAVINVPPSSIDPGHLIRIDPSTGIGTDIGSFGLSSGSGEEITLADLTFDPTTGVLYGWRANTEGDLYTVDLATGLATKVGESGFTGLGGGGLSFGPGGKLFLAGEGTTGSLRIIDKATGEPIDSVSLSGYADFENISALTYDGGKFLYGITRKAGELIRIDANTGVIETIGPAASDAAIDGLAFDSPCFDPAAAPAASGIGLIALALAVLTLGVRRLAVRS